MRFISSGLAIAILSLSLVDAKPFFKLRNPIGTPVVDASKVPRTNGERMALYVVNL